MASPIRWFRKHSQFFIVIFGVVLMAIFGLGSVLTSLNPSSLSRGSRNDDDVVVKWSGGEMKRDDLARLRTSHFAAQRLMDAVQRYALTQNGDQNFPPVDRIYPIIRPGEDPSTDEMDQRIFNRFLFSKRAEQEGFVVDEQMALDHLAQFAGDVPLSKNMLQQINREVNPQTRLTSVIRQVQMELLWKQMELITSAGLPFNPSPIASNAISPTEAIQLYERLNRRITCLAMPIPIDQYVSTLTEEPPASELKVLYDEGKYDFPAINFERPGFKMLKQARIQYFVGEMDTFVENEMAKLTDEQVQEEYDRLVAADDNLVMEVVPVNGAEAEKNADAATTEGASDSVDPAPARDEADDDPAPSLDSEGGSDGPATDEAGGDGNEQKSEENEEGADVQDESLEGGNDGGPRTFFTSLTQEDNEPGEQDESADPVKESADQPVDENKSDEVVADDEAAKELPTEAASVQVGDDSDDTDQSSTTNQEPGTNSPTVSTDPVIADPVETERRAKPLTDVADAIKRSMVAEDARIARDKAMDAAEKELRMYQLKIGRWEFEKQKDADAPRPEVPDFNAIADELGIQFLESGLINETQIKDERIGKVVRFEFIDRQPMQVDVGQQIFRNFDKMPLFQPSSVQDFATRSSYLHWLAEKVEQKVPSFEEAEESLTEYWKHEKGIELATAEAQDIVSKLGSEDKLLSDLYPEKAQDTGAFSWFASLGRISYGAPQGVETPAEDFMEVAFGLEPKKAGAALNDNRDIVYVVQAISSEQMTTEQLGTDYIEKNFFLRKRVPQEVASVMNIYRQRMNFDWIEEFRREMEVEVIGQ